MLEPGLTNNSFEFGAQINPDSELILRTLAAGRAVDAASARSLAAGTVVTLRGVTAPGPAGPLTAPLSGRPCVWYRSAFFPGAQYAPVPSIAPSDGPPAINDHQARRSMNPSEEISRAGYRVVGPDGDGVTIDPLEADVDTDVLAMNEQWHGEHDFSRGLMVEWILPVGAPVLAAGALGPGATLVAAADAALLVSTRDRERVVQRHQAGADRGAHASRARVIRLQQFSTKAARAGRAVQLGVWIFTALVAVAIVITVVVQLA